MSDAKRCVRRPLSAGSPRPRARSWIGAWLVVATLVAISGPLGCGARLAFWRSAPAGPTPDLERGVEIVETDAIAEFQARAQAFYDLVSRRRFNTYATYKDSALREHFRSEEAYFDYYADLAQDLVDAHFEKSRPLLAEVKEFALEAPGRARVAVRLKGDNGLPLRWWTTILEREDVWERVDGTWWVVPKRL